ncbi:MAG: alpha/beta hydrolase [Pirellulales bacterium]|nr:alpha/beta hydrolase [Pirellulales bacterium]
MIRLIERWLVFPAPPRGAADWNPTDLSFEDVFFSAADGTRLHGWYVPHPEPRAEVLYCHGNGEHVALLAKRLQILNERIGVSVFAWDYRGYGKSAGKPHETNVIPDARAAQLWLANRVDGKAEDLVILGRSLGGAVTVALAAEFPVRGLVLDRTFSRLTDAAAHNFPWLPLRFFMRNRFSSVERIRNYHGPLLQTHGTADEVVPLAQGRQLFDAAPSVQKRFIEVRDGNHNGPLPEHCYEALIEFLDSLAPVDRPGPSTGTDDGPT